MTNAEGNKQVVESEVQKIINDPSTNHHNIVERLHNIADHPDLVFKKWYEFWK